jgi:hypothetical protein
MEVRRNQIGISTALRARAKGKSGNGGESGASGTIAIYFS